MPLRFSRLLVLLAMLLSIAAGPAATAAPAANPCGRVGYCPMPCCTMHQQHGAADPLPSPVSQQAGRDLAASLTSAPFSALFTIALPQPPRAPRSLFIARIHAPPPLAATCIQLI